jgi:PAS domain S-box-containing protein
MVEVGRAPQGGGSATEGSCPSSYERRGPTGPVVSAASAELGDALSRCPFPLFVWTDDGVIRLANESAAELLGETLPDVIGQKIIDRFGPRDEVARTKATLSSGLLVRAQTKRVVRRSDGTEVTVWVWSRVMEVDDVRAVVSITVPTAELAGLGRDPEVPWRDLVPIAVGVADSGWCIEAITSDVSSLFGYDAEELVGRSFLEFVPSERVSEVTTDGSRPPNAPFHLPGMLMKEKGGGWMRVCLLVAPLPDRDHGEVIFGIVGPALKAWSTLERVAELELRLRRIGAEVRAAGVLENVHTLPPHVDHPELSELTTRQWEILSLLMQGMRVPSIAGQLYVSPSTVRNHLATIFRKFGVHSQSALLELLRSPPDQDES